jgi:hypothetical protein
VKGVAILIAAVLVTVAGCGAVVHAERRRSKWYRLRGPLLPWWQTFPFAYGRVRLEAFDPDTWAEQLGTTGELVAGVAAVLLGGLYVWAMMSGSVNVQ